MTIFRFLIGFIIIWFGVAFRNVCIRVYVFLSLRYWRIQTVFIELLVLTGTLRLWWAHAFICYSNTTVFANSSRYIHIIDYSLVLCCMELILHNDQLMLFWQWQITNQKIRAFVCLESCVRILKLPVKLFMFLCCFYSLLSTNSKDVTWF